jgi:hypothetical protein
MSHASSSAVLAQSLQLFNSFEVRRLTRKGDGAYPDPRRDSKPNLTNHHQ